MIYTPYLDSLGIKWLDESVPDLYINLIDNLLSIANSTINWGEYKGKKRKPCVEQPLLLTSRPIGQYHCPMCGMMIMAGVPHLSPASPKEQDPNYYIGEYEEEYGQPWPPGYED